MVCHCQLPLLTLEETAGYIVKRLAWAGSQEPSLFAPQTVQEIYRCSNGNPRVINLICEHALVSSYADRRNSVDLSDVTAIAQEFELGGATDQGQASSRSTFCRVIPFPQLDVTDPESPPEEVATAVVVAQAEPEKHIINVAAEANVNRAVALPILAPPAIGSQPEPMISWLTSVASLLRSRILSYSRSVSNSLVRDVEQCLEWLNKPSGTPPGADPAGQLARGSVRKWLITSAGSQPMISPQPRVSSARQKHS
jgi:hypothetical protein